MKKGLAMQEPFFVAVYRAKYYFAAIRASAKNIMANTTLPICAASSIFCLETRTVPTNAIDINAVTAINPRRAGDLRFFV
jgi:hypothetical protein